MSQPTNGTLKIVEKLVMELKASQLEIERLTNEISNLKTIKRELEEEKIPDIMMENGMTKLTLSSGISVDVRPFYFARVPKENPKPFYDWLTEHGHGALIKSHFEVWTTDKSIESLIKLFCNEYKIPFDLNQQIHWKTLEAWFKEQTENQVKLPVDLFENYVGKKAWVK